jgi:hypothetical protein
MDSQDYPEGLIPANELRNAIRELNRLGFRIEVTNYEITTKDDKRKQWESFVRIWREEEL